MSYSANKRTIAVASGKGGTGKTTVALSLFNLLERTLNLPVGLVDCDVEEPNDLLFFNDLSFIEEKDVHQLIPEIDIDICTFCKRCVEWCAFNAITIVADRRFATVDASLCHSCGACSVACRDGAITEVPHPLGKITHYKTKRGNFITEGRLVVGSPMQTMLIGSLKKFVEERSLITILDAPPGTSCPVVETVSDADYVILVAEPTPFGVNDLKITVEMLQEINIPYGVVINKAGLGSDEIYQFLDDEEIDLLAEIPYSSDLARSYASGTLLREGAVVDIEKEISGFLDRVL